MRDRLSVNMTVSYEYDKESLDELKKHIVDKFQSLLNSNGYNFNVMLYPETVIYRIVIGVMDESKEKYMDKEIAHIYIDSDTLNITFFGSFKKPYEHKFRQLMDETLKNLPSDLIRKWTEAVKCFYLINSLETYDPLFKDTNIKIDNINFYLS